MNLQDLYDWLFHQNADGTGIPLKATGIVLGLGLLAKHLWALLYADQAIAIAKNFPRNRAWGVILLAISLLWTLFLIAHMDMADFYPYRRWLLMGLPVAFVLIVVCVPEFLAVRALGSLMLLAASPVLSAAFLQPQTSRLLVPILAYAWIIVGMFLVGMPFLIRDWITWLSADKARWKLAMLAGECYGAALFLAAVFFY